MSIRIFNLKRLELALLLVGLALVGFSSITYLRGRVYSRLAIERFHADPTSKPAKNLGGKTKAIPVDYSLWSPKRIQGYKTSLAEHFDEPLALLRVEKIHLEVPVFDGTDERVLNRGVGRIAGTARVGEEGNIGIAGHRDGFFRGLKDIEVGDTIQLEASTGTRAYRIDSIKLVSPENTSVLRNDSTPTLTLVTCFPFYYVGSAPQRYIVHASLKGETKK